MRGIRNTLDAGVKLVFQVDGTGIQLQTACTQRAAVREVSAANRLVRKGAAQSLTDTTPAPILSHQEKGLVLLDGSTDCKAKDVLPQRGFLAPVKEVAGTGRELSVARKSLPRLRNQRERFPEKVGRLLLSAGARYARPKLRCAYSPGPGRHRTNAAGFLASSSSTGSRWIW